MDVNVKEEPIDELDEFESSWLNYEDNELKKESESAEQGKTEEDEEKEVKPPLALFVQSFELEEEAKRAKKRFEEVGYCARVEIKNENESFQGANRAALEGSPSLQPAMPPLCRILHTAKKTDKKEQGAKKTYKCSECAFETIYLYNYKVHIRNHGGEGLIWCRLCNCSARQSTHVRTHICQHNMIKYVCSRCGFKALTKGSLKQHLLQQHKEGINFKCSQCDFTTSAKEHLKIHKHTHMGGEVYTCSHCGFATSTKSFLSKHKCTHVWTAKKPYKCLQCDFSAFTQYSLNEHTYLHRRERPYKCSLCEFRSTTQTSLKLHERKHKQVSGKLYKCLKCDFTSSQQKLLVRHQHTHGEPRPFKCPYCEFAGTRSGYLRLHLRVHLGDKYFRCIQCSESFSNQLSLSQHLCTYPRVLQTTASQPV